MSTPRKMPNLPNKSGFSNGNGSVDAPIDIHRVLLEGAPKGQPKIFARGKSRSKSAIVLEVRLAQEKPQYLDAYQRGEYKSVTAAATAAGLLKDDANLRRTKSGWRKMTLAQRKEFREWEWCMMTAAQRKEFWEWVATNPEDA